MTELGNIFNLQTANSNPGNYIGTSTLDHDATLELRLRINGGMNYQNCKLKPMLVLGSQSSMTFEPCKGESYTLTNGVPDHPVTTLNGENHIWADVGDVDVTYKADIPLTIENLKNRITALEGAT